MANSKILMTNLSDQVSSDLPSHSWAALLSFWTFLHSFWSASVLESLEPKVLLDT
jgi:hypothetical protein